MGESFFGLNSSNRLWWPWAAGHIVLIAAIVWLLFSASNWALIELAKPESTAAWEEWREDVRANQNRPVPVQRRVPKSAEPPALVLTRDYFLVITVGAVLFSSLLYWVMAWFVMGILKGPETSVPDLSQSNWPNVVLPRDSLRSPADNRLIAFIEASDTTGLAQALSDPQANWTAEKLAAALSAAAWRIDDDCVNILMEHGADPSLKYRGAGGPAIHNAVEQQNLPIVRKMLEAGADPNACADGGWTVLHGAIDIEVDGAQQAQTEPTCDLTRLLLEFGANPLAEDMRGRTPLDMARTGHHWEAVELMEQYLKKKSAVE